VDNKLIEKLNRACIKDLCREIDNTFITSMNICPGGISITPTYEYSEKINVLVCSKCFNDTERRFGHIALEDSLCRKCETLSAWGWYYARSGKIYISEEEEL